MIGEENFKQFDLEVKLHLPASGEQKCPWPLVISTSNCFCP
jgi:hypothetical protein